MTFHMARITPSDPCPTVHEEALEYEVAPVDDTLRRVVVLCRLVGWAWSLAVITAHLQNHPGISRDLAVASGLLGTMWAGLTIYGARDNRFLRHPLFVLSDSVAAALLAGAGWAAGAPDFISGGFPMSWLFVVAYATSLRWTMAAAITATLYSALFHGLMNLGAIRTLGSIQFLVVGWIAGWAFDALRKREALRLAAESNLRSQQQASARYEERAILASRLHDSVLQTLNVIRTHADDPDEVRYLARRQERELRRTIDEYRSPYTRSFRAELLATRDRVEDLCRVDIEAVVRDDADLDATLASAVGAAHEALVNAGKHSGAKQVHLYSEVAEGRVTVNVRDRGKGLSGIAQSGQEALWDSLNERVSGFGGKVTIQSAVGEGTDVSIVLPRP